MRSQLTEEGMTVGELVELLQPIPPDTRIVRIGHFGEAHEYIKSSFRHTRKYFEITPPNIGGEPD